MADHKKNGNSNLKCIISGMKNSYVTHKKMAVIRKYSYLSLLHRINFFLDKSMDSGAKKTLIPSQAVDNHNKLPNLMHEFA